MRGWIGAIVRFIVSAFVLLGIGFILPNVEIAGFTNALIASIIIAALGYVAENLLGENITPQARGLTGFVAATVVIYFTQFLLARMSVTFIGAMLAAIIIGVVDTFVPTELR
ncbi:phage holin family protein [Halonatronum saccharophilum]|uniref:phage holin family protein n=1 Tax=Halonatronum saccharophilum TaxID=150060 RepID=UPI00047F6270|nr:phage holin family protein [Halonatronum saccharophilum]